MVLQQGEGGGGEVGRGGGGGGEVGGWQGPGAVYMKHQ